MCIAYLDECENGDEEAEEKNKRPKEVIEKKGQSSFRMHRHFSCTSIIILVAFLLTCDFAMFVCFFRAFFCVLPSSDSSHCTSFCYCCSCKGSKGEIMPLIRIAFYIMYFLYFFLFSLSLQPFEKAVIVFVIIGVFIYSFVTNIVSFNICLRNCIFISIVNEYIIYAFVVFVSVVTEYIIVCALVCLHFA